MKRRMWALSYPHADPSVIFIDIKTGDVAYE